MEFSIAPQKQFLIPLFLIYCGIHLGLFCKSAQMVFALLIAEPTFMFVGKLFYGFRRDNIQRQFYMILTRGCLEKKK